MQNDHLYPNLENPQTELEYLHNRLTDPTLTVGEYQRYTLLVNESATQSGMLALPPPNYFVTDDMLLEYWKAQDWWPKGLEGYTIPTLAELALQAAYSPHTGQQPRTLSQLLAFHTARVVEYLELNDISVVNPNETPAQRAKRKARERTARSRERKKLIAAGVPVEELVPAVRDSAPAAPLTPAQQHLLELKAQRDKAKEDADAWVKEAWKEMMRRSEQRKEYLTKLDALIEDAERVVREEQVTG